MGKNIMERVALMVFVVCFGLCAVTAYAAGTDCTGYFGDPYTNGQWSGPFDLPPGGSGGWKYTEKVAHERICAGADAAITDTMQVQTYTTNKYQIAGGGGHPDWFGLSGSWQNETVSVSGYVHSISVSNGGCDGPCWIYEKRHYSQKCRVMIKKSAPDAGIYCVPCNAEISTLEESPSLLLATSEKPIYDPGLKGSQDACNVKGK